MYRVAGSRSSRALITAAIGGLLSCVNVTLSFLLSVELLSADPNAACRAISHLTVRESYSKNAWAAVSQTAGRQRQVKFV